MSRPRVQNEIPSMADRDKDKLFVCPYNKYHRITAMKYPGHLATCRKQYTGKAYKQCPFNARHEFPAVEYDYHVSTCPDKNRIERELSSPRSSPNVQPVDHSQNNVFDSAEDWESEANHVAFSISGDPLQQEQMTAYDAIEEFNEELLRRASNVPSETPVDMSKLSKAQKKNLKRAQKRREKHLSNVNGDDDGDDNGDDDSNSDGLNQASGFNSDGLNQASGFNSDGLNQATGFNSALSRPSNGAFVDWVSILNQYCQSNRINQPKYYEETNPHGGFGSSVVVSSERFFSDCYADTKKKAKHYAARAALLGLNIPISDAAPCRAPHQSHWTDIDRARELSDQASLISSRISRPQRVIPGLNPATPPAPPKATHATPSTTTSRDSRPSPQNITEPMAGMTIQDEEGEWQEAPSRRRKETRSNGKNALRLAGIGRGRARK